MTRKYLDFVSGHFMQSIHASAYDAHKLFKEYGIVYWDEFEEIIRTSEIAKKLKRKKLETAFNIAKEELEALDKNIDI